MIEPPALGESALAAAAPGFPASTSAIAAVDPAATGAPTALGEAETATGEAEADTGDAVTDAGAAAAGAGEDGAGCGGTEFVGAVGPHAASRLAPAPTNRTLSAARRLRYCIETPPLATAPCVAGRHSTVRHLFELELPLS
jgi:hypothetical protein